jgi:uncharacterized NAD(P)/FAD-binding protein YdhS
MTHIAVIGAGLSGRLLAFNLIRLASPEDSLRLVDRGDHLYMGPAYSGEEDNLLLNVPADRMGAFSQDPEHFLKWAQEQGVSAGNGDFLSRRLYRDYILDLLQKAQQARTNGPAFVHLCEEITDIEAGPNGVVLHTQANVLFRADKAVLALGNFPPRHPAIQNRSALSSGRYVRDPWAPGVLSSLGKDDTVFLIGTGQTTVDLIIALHRRGHKGRMVPPFRGAVSCPWRTEASNITHPSSRRSGTQSVSWRFSGPSGHISSGQRPWGSTTGR